MVLKKKHEREETFDRHRGGRGVRERGRGRGVGGGGGKKSIERSNNSLFPTLYLFMHSFLVLVGTASEILSHLSVAVAGNVFKACSSLFCSSVCHALGPSAAAAGAAAPSPPEARILNIHHLRP